MAVPHMHHRCRKTKATRDRRAGISMNATQRSRSVRRGCNASDRPTGFGHQQGSSLTCVLLEFKQGTSSPKLEPLNNNVVTYIRFNVKSMTAKRNVMISKGRINKLLREPISTRNHYHSDVISIAFNPPSQLPYRNRYDET